jgi:nitrogen fixation/metabolism regulation signal transduction histidine kinase
MNHMTINVDTARSLVRDHIAMTRGMPSAAYLEKVLTGLVQAAMRTDSERAVYRVNESLSLTPTWSRLPTGHVLVEWKLMTA